ncbi:histidine kinase dimerization/phosphoacceptor domain -containing protein, partial [Aliarcobacter butzleri]
VKNNLALTISLIELQDEDIEDKKTKKVLVNIQERIYTMELLHSKLYESTNLNKIPFKSYTLYLIKTISKTYDKDEK